LDVNLEVDRVSFLSWQVEQLPVTFTSFWNFSFKWKSEEYGRKMAA
jgi:hypothetical protein